KVGMVKINSFSLIPHFNKYFLRPVFNQCFIGGIGIQKRYHIIDIIIEKLCKPFLSKHFSVGIRSFFNYKPVSSKPLYPLKELFNYFLTYANLYTALFIGKYFFLYFLKPIRDILHK